MSCNWSVGESCLNVVYGMHMLDLMVISVLSRAEDMFCSLDSGPMVMRDSNPNTWREQSRSSF